MSSPFGPNLTAASLADLALVRAARAWGGLFQARDRDLELSLWARFSPPLRARLTSVWPWAIRMTPEEAWRTLLHDQAASARFDPDRVHPSWFERILQAESPAVRALVRAASPEPIRSKLDPGQGDPSAGRRDSAAPASTHFDAANPEVVQWVLTLWAERLVGGVVESPHDPPIILALSQLSLRDLARLIQVLGQVKYAFSIAAGSRFEPPDPAITRTTAAALVRIGFFRRTIGRADPRLVPIAVDDFGSVTARPRDRFAAVGLITVARLLRAAEPSRARWAVQHIPYPVARLIRTLEGKPGTEAAGLPARAIQGWESWILEAAWARLLTEGRLAAADRGASP